MLRFKVNVDIMSEKWEDESQKKVFMKNAEEVIQRGLMMMTVPDWFVTVVDAEEIELIKRLVNSLEL